MPDRCKGMQKQKLYNSKTENLYYRNILFADDDNVGKFIRSIKSYFSL